MAKATDAIKDLQRRLGHLARLDGVVVRTADGPVLLRPLHIDPFALADACRSGRPRLAAVLAAIACDGEPLHITPARLARAHRDLLRLAAFDWHAIVRGAPRQFRSFGPLDARWLATREARLGALALALQQPPADDTDPIVDLVTDLHGPAAAAVLDEWLQRSAGIGGQRRREAERRLAGLHRRLLDPHAAPTEPAPLAAFLDLLAAELLRLTRLPGRAAARKLEPLVRRALAWPQAASSHAPVPEDSPARPVPKDISPATRLALAARVHDLGATLVTALGTTRGAAHMLALRRVLGRFALAFPVDPAAPAPHPFAPDELERAEGLLRATTPGGDTLPLTLSRAVWLLRLPLNAPACLALAPWISAGLAPALVEQVIALKQHTHLTALTGDVALATAYADWLVRLVPHYRRLGIKVDLRPEHFARLHATHRGGLALLAHCLIEHHAPDERGADAQVARLRATLGLFTARPRRTEALLTELADAPAGRGRQHFPELAAWLGDTTQLDRYCHLSVLAGEPVTLSAALRRDFDRHDRLVRQRDHLAAQPALTPALQARLVRLDTELTQALPTDRGWTLRRLAERCELLQARAFARKLDELLRDLLREAIGVTPPALTPAWRDVLRFYLGAATRNRALLGELLRFAATHPATPISPTLPRNHAWLARAAAHMRTDAWLAPQVRTLELAGGRHILTLEPDPLEVLRMGIPFDTCLALDDGFNADSTVLNAVDINKRVLYLRDARGSIIARKLIAVSSEFGLLGYRLYCARDAADRPDITAAFDALCTDLAHACGLPLTNHGVPEQIHPGFWYDDGPAGWGTQHNDLAALAPYFAALGRPVPTRLSEWAHHRPRAWLAVTQGDLETALAVRPHLRTGPVVHAVDTMILARLGARELARRARRDRELAHVHVATQLARGPAAALRAALDVTYDRALWSGLAEILDHALPCAELTRAWFAAALHERRHAVHLDDHGLAHRTVRMAEALACLPVAEILARCPDLTHLWDWIVAEQSSCAQCREFGVLDLHRALTHAHAREPDPDAIVAALRGRHGPLAQDAALHIAARFSLAHRPCPLRHGLGASWLTRLTQRPLPAQHALRALRELLRARPALAELPDMFAALVRQAGPHAPHSDLPRPTTAPFTPLAELVLHLPDLAALLAPWLDPDIRASSWKPGPEELHVHRVTPTPWRRHLTRRAIADDPEDPANPANIIARLWLARLGELATLTRLGARRHLELAAYTHAQPALRDRPADVPCDMSLLTAASEARALLGTRDPATLDLALLREAVRALDPPHDPTTLRLAFDLLRATDLTPEIWADILDRLLAPAGPTPALVPMLRELLADAALRTLPAPLLARLAADPELHPPLLEHIERGLRSYHLDFATLYSQLEQAPGLDPTIRDALLDAYITRAGTDAANFDSPFGTKHDTHFARCLPIWTRAAPDLWLAIYKELHDLHLQSQLLGALLTLPPERDADLTAIRHSALTGWTPHEHDHDEATARQWLLEAIPATPCA